MYLDSTTAEGAANQMRGKRMFVWDNVGHITNAEKKLLKSNSDKFCNFQLLKAPLD